MYCIVFNGRVLEGYVPTQVKAAVAARLRLGPAEIKQLFSGRQAILKKNVPESTARQYLSILRGLGMNAALAPMPAVAGPASTSPVTLKIVFWGQVVEGFSLIGVMRAAAARLKLTKAQADRLFEGSKVVLQRGVSPERAARYVRELALIGMVVEFEAETAPEVRQKATPTLAGQVGEEAFASMLGTQFELPKGSADLESGIDITAESPVVSAPAVPSRPTLAAREARASSTAASGGEYVRCSQCGHRQAWRDRCAVCGVIIERREGERRLPRQRLDASAFSAPTTVLGSLPRHGNAVAAETPTASHDAAGGRQSVSSTEGQRTASMSVHKRHLVALSVLMLVIVCVLW